LGSIQDLQVAASIIGKAAIAIPSRPPRLHLEFHRNLHGGNRRLIKSKNLIWGDQDDSEQRAAAGIKMAMGTRSPISRGEFPC
jgi:hypothetical protein